MTGKYGVIVDGYSTGSGLAKEFAKYGIQCLHVQSQQNIPSIYKHTFNIQDYIENFIFDDSLKTLIEKLKPFKPSFVLVGAECGIELADAIAEELNLPGNGTTLSACRRNKHLMMEQITKNKLQAIPSFFSTNLEEILEWANKESFWPLVIKPANSAGGEGFTICHSLEEISPAYSRINEKAINMLGIKNNGVLIQHYITGKEYVINTVSYEGQHKLCEMWEYTRYFRDKGQQIYDTATMLSFNPNKHTEILEYSTNVLDALGIKYGPAHVEILVNENGCYLVELGARLMGANLPFDLLSKCITTPQAIMTVLAYSQPEIFLNDNHLQSEIIQPLMALFMVSDKDGVIKKINHLDKIEKLASFYAMKLALKTGDKLNRTIDYQTSPGMIYLSHSSNEVLLLDKERIRSLEKTMFEV